MKTKLYFLQGILIVMTIGFPVSLFSQCPGSTTPLTVVYDTTVIGTGNDYNTLSFPKFNPALGTLLSADLKSVVSLKYSYDLENQTASNQVFKTRIVRTDIISGAALDPSPISAVNQTPYSPYLILSHQQLHYGPANMGYTVNNSINDGRLVNFMGAGMVDLDYETGTSAAVQGPLPWQLNFTSVTDTTRFSITYRYCVTTLLSADLLFFSASPLNDNKVSLTWRQANVEASRVYNVQLSTDGRNFTDIAAVKENNSGSYNYTWLNNNGGRLYFRIEQKNAAGGLKYSNVRIIESNQKPVVKVYPSLYTGGNLHIGFPAKGTWQVNFYAAEGRKITSATEKDVHNTDLILPPVLSNGFYTVEVINMQTQQRQLNRIVVQR